jgi:predicted cobalt transporter CbtA
VKRIILVASVALVMAAMVVVMAMPALAAKPLPTKAECQAAFQAEQPTGQQKQLVKRYDSQGQCIQASRG